MWTNWWLLVIIENKSREAWKPDLEEKLDPSLPNKCGTGRELFNQLSVAGLAILQGEVWGNPRSGMGWTTLVIINCFCFCLFFLELLVLLDLIQAPVPAGKPQKKTVFSTLRNQLKGSVKMITAFNWPPPPHWIIVSKNKTKKQL